MDVSGDNLFVSSLFLAVDACVLGVLRLTFSLRFVFLVGEKLAYSTNEGIS